MKKKNKTNNLLIPANKSRNIYIFISCTRVIISQYVRENLTKT